MKRLSDQHYAIGLTTIFLMVGAFAASNHEMWRDEIQAWLLARDSTSLLDLFRHMKYEGHPALWNIFLMPLTRLTKSPIAMQVLHLFIAATTVYLFARYSPFNRLQKFLFAFGYFTFYEYSIVCRNYALGFMLICVFCLMFSKRYTRFPLVGVVLLLLAHTSVHALILVIVTAFSLLLDYLFSRNRFLAEKETNERHIWLGFGLIALGIITAVLQVNPPTDSGWAIPWYWDFDANRLTAVLKVITRAYIPVLEFKAQFWWSQWLETQSLFSKYHVLLSCLLIIWFSLGFLRKPIAFLVFLGGTLGLLAFFYVKYFGEIRHHGFLFILFIMVAWISPSCNNLKRSPRISRLSETLGKSQRYVLTLVLFCQMVGGITAVHMDNRHVFSYGKLTAEYIKEQGISDMLIVGEIDHTVSTVVGYLEKDRVYYPRGARFGSFVKWDKARTRRVSDQQVIDQAEALGRRHEEDVLIILDHALKEHLVKRHVLAELAHFDGAAIALENFHLYLVQSRREPRSS